MHKTKVQDAAAASRLSPGKVWRHNACWLSSLCLIFLLLPYAEITTAAEQAPPSGLLVYGSGGAANWEHSFNESLRDQLGPELGQYFTPEFLSLILADDSQRALIADSLALKYSLNELTLIVAVLSEANTFIRDYKQIFAPDAAVLRVLPGDEFLDTANRRDNEVVLASALPEAIANTTKLLPDFFPQLESIYLIGGAGAGDQEFMNRYRRILAGLELPYDFTYLSGLPPDDLIAEISLAPRNSAVMTTTYDVDRNGRPLRSLLITEQIVNELSLPVIAASDPQIPAGAIGGSVTTVSAYARTARRLIQDMIDGNFSSEPVSAETDFLFNGQQLDRFDIDRNLLPGDSVIISDTPDVWRDYGLWILLGVTLIAVQGALIVLLLEARRRRSLAEEQLSRVYKMEALGTLAGGIAHDFNNILMSMMANTELLSFRFTNDPDTQKQISKIMSSAERAKNLVTQILMFSRQSGGSEMTVRDIRELTAESVEQIRAALPSSCSLEIREENNLATVRVDASQIYQVISNLCINAQHAMPDGGPITINLVNCHTAESMPALNGPMPAGKYVCIAISDAGTGISDEDLSHIFEPFYTTKAHGKGTGLGLSLVYQIIKNHNGYIALETEPGSGSTFSIYLPASDQPTAPDSRERPKQLISGANEEILLVDDDEMVLDANQKILDGLGYRVTPFSNSVEALSAFKQKPRSFDLVLTDLSMPEMDGIRLIDNIRQIRPDIPVILCTGYPDAIDTSDMQGLRLLRKPASIAEISRALKAELPGSSRTR